LIQRSIKDTGSLAAKISGDIDIAAMVKFTRLAGTVGLLTTIGLMTLATYMDGENPAIPWALIIAMVTVLALCFGVYARVRGVIKRDWLRRPKRAGTGSVQAGAKSGRT